MDKPNNKRISDVDSTNVVLDVRQPSFRCSSPDSLPLKEEALNYLAELIVEAFLDQK